ncbi:P-loop containing nucleoside triphosphate hydrolase protein [Mycena haematopus]|nr:P-loop containing nucleoside triphosphate hydrolase protein [Mycena haematopus]
MDAEHSTPDHSDSDSQEDSDANSLPLATHNFILQSQQTLSNLVEAFPNVSQEQRKAWSSTTSRLAMSTLPTYKFALVGKTGSGKSTLINCLLEQPTAILPSSAVRACTSAVTEIAFKDSDGIEGTVHFLSKEQWSYQLRRLLDDISSHEEDSEESPAAVAKEKLLKIYPQFKDQDLTSSTKKLLKQMMNVDSVRDRLGTSFELPPSDDFRLQLEQFLSASGNSDAGVLWPLVQRVEIRGKFPVLSTGIILVDLPGHGDGDETRNNSAAEYIKNADGVILVVDVKRAQDDRDTRAYLRTMINQFIIDGRSVEDSVVLVATGTDIPFNENEIAVGEGDREKIHSLNKELMDLRKSTRPPNKHQSKSRQQLDVEDKIREKEREKGLVLALSRIAKARFSIQCLFRQINAGLAPAENAIPQLPVFCVGSHDFLALLTGFRTPLTFFNEDATEIVDLKKHITGTGESRRLRWVTDLLGRADTFSESVHLYFSEDRYPGQLVPEDKEKALGLLIALETSNLQELKDGLDGIEEVLSDIARDLAKAVAKTMKAAPKVLQKFGALHWNTYKACMRCNGVYFEYDLNRELTQTILPGIQSTWNGGINYRVPLIIKDVIRSIEQSTFKAIDDVVEVLAGRGTLFEQTVSGTRRSLAIENILGDALERSIKCMSDAQRSVKFDARRYCSLQHILRAASRSFRTTVQDHMSEQYQSVAQESGPGSWERMKKSNHEFIKQNGPSVFNPINSRTDGLLHEAITKIRVDVKTELRDMTVLLRLRLIDEINLSEDHLDLKESILQFTAENRPRFAAKRKDLEDRRVALNMDLDKGVDI